MATVPLSVSGRGNGASTPSKTRSEIRSPEVESSSEVGPVPTYPGWAFCFGDTPQVDRDGQTRPWVREALSALPRQPGDGGMVHPVGLGDCPAALGSAPPRGACGSRPLKVVGLRPASEFGAPLARGRAPPVGAP